MLDRICKPWYLYRPVQFVRRARSVFGTKGVRTIRLPWGGRLLVDTSKLIGQSIVRTGVYDLTMSEILFRLAEPGDYVVDVGANVGYATALMSQCVGNSGQVLAIEAHPQIYTLLLENVALLSRQGYANVEAVQCAVSQTRGQVEIECSNEFELNDGTAHVVSHATATSFTMQSMRLDDVVTPDIAIKLVKIDVEGHELSVLKGAERCLESQIEHVVYEDHHTGISEVTQYLQSKGFSVFQFGWTLTQLKLASLHEPTLVRSYEPRNLVATKNLEYLSEKCRRRGWRVLGH